MIALKSTDEHVDMSRGRIWFATLPADVADRDDFAQMLAAIGPVTLDGVPRTVVAVESHCIPRLRAGAPIGLLLAGMKHKVSELEGALLDAAVVKAEGAALPDFWRDPDDGTCWARPGREEWKPSERWDQGGPIIERERISVSYSDQGGRERGGWVAYVPDGPLMFDFDGPLIAAMRAYVASKLGEEVEL